MVSKGKLIGQLWGNKGKLSVAKGKQKGESL